MPEYVAAEEVRRVCRELGIRYWSRLKDCCFSCRAQHEKE